MEIGRVPYFTPNNFTSNLRNQDIEGGKSNDTPIEDPKQKAAEVKNIPSVEISEKPDLKEAAREMLFEQQKMGEFKDKKGFEETTDPHMGGDIRYALKTRNIDLLKRLSWGGLTVSEFREVKHRIRELQNKMVENTNVLDGKLIDPDRKFKTENKESFTSPNIDIRV